MAVLPRYDLLLTSLDDAGVLTITLNRPEKLNAYNVAMGQELRAAFLWADVTDDVKAVVVTGAGRGFCAGADLKPGGGGVMERAVQPKIAGIKSRPENSFVDAIFACRKPSIAAINGPAVGVGITMTLPMDIRIMGASARFGFVFARRGLVPEAGSTWFLPRLVGLTQALRWCYEADLYDAAEALRGGLVSEIAPDGECLAHAQALARAIVKDKSSVSLALMRRMFWQGMADATPAAMLALDAQLVRELAQGCDAKEGVQSFLEKRPPRFEGRVSADLPPSAPWRNDGLD